MANIGSAENVQPAVISIAERAGVNHHWFIPDCNQGFMLKIARTS
jgi:hypothetical protein